MRRCRVAAASSADPDRLSSPSPCTSGRAPLLFGAAADPPVENR
jgi:hypothetical protein